MLNEQKIHLAMTRSVFRPDLKKIIWLSGYTKREETAIKGKCVQAGY